MDLSKTLKEYFSELSSNSPTPGGGNVAAMCGALAASLGTMVCNLTIGKKKYAAVEQEMIALKEKLENYQQKFFELGEKDNLAFNKVMDAFKLPKETESEIEFRSQEIENATLGAADIPTQVMQAAREMIPLLKCVIEKGNKNSISDAGVASALIDTTSKSAYLNVIINCNALNNQIIAEEIKKRADILLDETWQASYSLLDMVSSEIKGN
jgi:methenyltetrahydrofolate cyclohydrolase